MNSRKQLTNNFNSIELITMHGTTQPHGLTGASTVDMAPFDWLPLQTIRGQTTHLPAADTFSELQAALCHDGYIAPAREGIHCIGATFDLHDRDPAVRTEDHRYNLGKLAAAVPAWRSALEALDPTTLDGRVGYRCASPDYLPLVGPAPDVPSFLRQFGQLRTRFSGPDLDTAGRGTAGQPDLRRTTPIEPGPLPRPGTGPFYHPRPQSQQALGCPYDSRSR